MSGYTLLTKKSKGEDNDDRDIISKLHQSVIGHILSRLPSKDAIRTSSLSKDWVYKWTSCYNIDIDDAGAIMEKRTKFINFVDKMLRPSHGLKEFRFLCYDKHISTHLNGWISTALRRNTESFEIHFPNCFELPKGFTNNTSLRNVKLIPSPTSRLTKPTPYCTLRVTNVNCFSSLTCLYLKNVLILNESTNSDDLVFTLPVLHTLVLSHCKWLNVKLMEFHSPALTTFKCETCWYAVENEYTINICEARLAKFEFLGGFRNIILTDSEVRTAILMNRWGCNLENSLLVRKLMEGFPGVMQLELSSDVCWAIEQSMKTCPLPRYDQLQRLVVGDVKLLIELLHSAQFLKFLEVEFNVCESSSGCDYSVVKPLPYCIPYQLEEVNIKCQYCRTYEKPVALAKFLLQNGVMLKKLHIYTIGCHFTSDNVVEPLLLYPRVSASVEISGCEMQFC